MNHIAQTIYNQFGGHKAMYMIGANNMTYDTNAFMFRFKMCKKFNHCTITLNSNDLYDVRFCKIWGCDIKRDVTFNDVYCDKLVKLFEEQTQLNTVLF